MRLTNKTKFALIALIAAVVIDMWRNWPWAKKYFGQFTKAVNSANKRVNGNEAA